MKHLILSTVCMLFCATGLWAQTLIDGIYYKFDKNTQTATVTNKIGDSSGSNSYSGSITIPSTVAYNGTSYSVTSIGDYAFYECTGLTNITIPNGVTKIGIRAFYFCSGLTSITIPNSVTSIGDWAFYQCTGLTNITIPNGVTKIGERAFYYCSGLTSITIPNSVTSIGDYAFYECRGLTSITIPNSVTSIGGGVFFNCIKLTSVTIPNSVTSIGICAFKNCTGLTSIEIPNSVTSIKSDAFYNCTGLTSVTIPNSVTSIENFTFKGCTGLTSVTIPNSVTSIGNCAFKDCTGLTSVTIPNSVTSIGYYVFEGCTGLTSIIVSCEKYDYFKEEISEYSSIVYGDCYFVIATIVNNENYGSVTGEGVYKCGTSITLTATPNDHYHFVKWNDNNTQNPRTVTVNGNKTYTAVFAIDEHNVTANANNENYGSVTGEGVYKYGTSITLTATPNDHYHFVKWNDNNTQNPRVVQVTQDRTFTAVFAIDEHNVTANANNENYGTVTGEGVYEYETSITLTATPNDHYHFVKWNDNNTQNPRTVQVTRDSTFTAIFAIDEHNVTLSKNISAAGTVTGDGVYEHNTTVQLTATANKGYRFKGWSDGVTDASREITVTKDTSITANFVALYTIKALASASQGTVSGGGVYEKGETATLVANAKPGYIFAQWADGSDENPRYVTVKGNKTYTAIFIDPDAATAAPEAEESIVEKSEVKKIIDRNGIIYIEKDGTRYFLNGSKVE